MDEDKIIAVDDRYPDEPELEQEEKEEEKPFEYSDDDENLAFVFADHPEGREAARKLVDEAYRNFQQDWEASEEYRHRVADDWKIWSGDLPPKNYPFKNASNPHVPMALENISRLVYRASGELFGNWDNVFGVVPLGPTDVDVADILTKHGNWQLRNQITDFKRQMYRAITMFFSIGNVTCKSFYDSRIDRNKHEVLTTDEFVTPYVMASMEPDYSDLPHYSQVAHLYRHDLQKMRGEWAGVDDILGTNEHGSWDDEPDAPLREAAAEKTGIETPEPGVHAPFKVVYYYGWTSLMPDREDDVFICLVFEVRTKTLLKLNVYMEDDWQETLRYEREMAELAEYRMNRSMFNQQVDALDAQDREARAAMNSETMGEFDKAEGFAGAMEVARAPLPEPPVPPAWMEDPTDPAEFPRAPRKRPIHVFSNGVCIEPMTGNVGLGYMHILGDMNRAANVALSQFADAAHMANSWGIITDRGVSFEGGFRIAPGHQNIVENRSVGELKNSIMELKPAPANPQLIELMKYMIEQGQSSTQAPSILSGESGKSGETYRGVAARIEQATKQLSVSTRKFADFFEEILKKNAKLNAQFLREEELIQVTSSVGTPMEPIRVQRRMYERDYRVEIRADLRFTSQAQRIAEADENLALTQSVPFMMNNMAFAHQALKDSLRARNASHLIPLLGPAPPQPSTPFGMPPMLGGPPGAPQPGMPSEGPPGPGDATKPPPEGQ